jgi:hypothetical protein
MENPKFLMEGYMKLLRAVLIMLVLMITFGCSHYSDITGRVIDAATGKPIEGAVVVAQWTKARGWLGEQQRELHKIIETLTDKEGKFSLSGTVGFVLDPPEMIIYKEGYMPWRNDMIFPSTDIVKNHEWKNKETYKLDVFTNNYSFGQLYSFIDSAIMGIGGSETPIFNEIHHKISVKRSSEIKILKLNEK